MSLKIHEPAEVADPTASDVLIAGEATTDDWPSLGTFVLVCSPHGGAAPDTIAGGTGVDTVHAGGGGEAL